MEKDKGVIRVFKTNAGQLVTDSRDGITTVIDPSSYKPIAKFQTEDQYEIVKLVRRCGNWLKLKRSLETTGVEIMPGMEQLLIDQYPGKDDENEDDDAEIPRAKPKRKKR